MIQIVIPFDPVPWAAPKLGRSGYAYDIREKDKRAIRYLIRQQYNKEPLKGPIGLSFEFFFSIPKSFSKKKTEDALADRIVPTKCDCTNLQKLYEDCLKNIVIEDDRNVFTILSQKRYAQKPAVIIEVYSKGEYQCE